MLSGAEELWHRWVKSRYMIKTPQIVKLYDTIEHMLLTGATGAIFPGRQRMGKTYAIRYVCNALQELIGPVPWIEVCVRNETHPSDLKFCRLILESTGYAITEEGRSADMRFRLTERLYEVAVSSLSRTVILVIDEAQAMSHAHLEWLLNITNEVDRCGASVLCLLVGQRELSTRKMTLAAGGFWQLLGRFMVEEHEIHGILSTQELRSCLEQYSILKYPVDANEPLLKKLIPENSWHPEQDADLIWHLFYEVWQDAGNSQGLEIPMKWFCSYFHEFILTNLRDSGELSSKELHRKAIIGSRFRSHAECVRAEIRR
jgi:hypothetical protein